MNAVDAQGDFGIVKPLYAKVKPTFGISFLISPLAIAGRPQRILVGVYSHHFP